MSTPAGRRDGVPIPVLSTIFCAERGNIIHSRSPPLHTSILPKKFWPVFSATRGLPLVRKARRHVRSGPIYLNVLQKKCGPSVEEYTSGNIKVVDSNCIFAVTLCIRSIWLLGSSSFSWRSSWYSTSHASTAIPLAPSTAISMISFALRFWL